MKYLHSIFTKKRGAGRCSLQIRSWLTNGEELSTEAKAEFRQLDKNGVEKTGQIDTGKKASQSEKDKKEIVLGKSKDFFTQDLMDSVEVTIFVT